MVKPKHMASAPVTPSQVDASIASEERLAHTEVAVQDINATLTGITNSLAALTQQIQLNNSHPAINTDSPMVFPPSSTPSQTTTSTTTTSTPGTILGAYHTTTTAIIPIKVPVTKTSNNNSVPNPPPLTSFKPTPALVPTVPTPEPAHATVAAELRIADL